MLNKIVRRIRRQIVIKLYEQRIAAYRDIEGFLSPYEAVTLHRLATQLPPDSTIVEIGSWKGKSTYCLARGLNLGRIIAIDPFDASGEPESANIYETQRGSSKLLDQFCTTMETLGVSTKIEVRQGFSYDFVGQTPRINLLFIDGDHSIDGCGFDFMNYSPFVIPGGYVAFHDYDASRKDLGPTWVVNNRVLPSGKYAFEGLFDSLWVGRKLPDRKHL